MERRSIIQMLSKASHKLHSARVLCEKKIYDDSASRAYYAVFHGISTVLASKDLFFSSHSQTIGVFNKEFVKTGIFPREYSKIIHDLFNLRETGDYDVIREIDNEEAEYCIAKSSEILQSIHQYFQLTEEEISIIKSNE